MMSTVHDVANSFLDPAQARERTLDSNLGLDQHKEDATLQQSHTRVVSRLPKAFP